MKTLFTEKERRVILLLASLLLLGNGIRLYRRVYTPGGGGSLDLGTLEPEDSAAVVDLLARSREMRNRKEDSAVTAGSPIDLNRADREDLLSLPGIGPVLADRILADRERNGPYRSVEELERVRGIGKERLKRLAPFLRIGAAAPAR